MNRSKILMLAIAACLIMAVFLHPFETGSKDTAGRRDASSKVENASDSGAGPIVPQLSTDRLVGAGKIETVFATPIVFYGKVQNQEGIPISGAQVTASVANKLGGGSIQLTTQSDSNGNFNVNSAGLALTVRVAKDGYLPMPGREPNGPRSKGGFDYGADLGGGIHRPDAQEPVVFTLFQPPEAEKLLEIDEVETVMPKNGAVVRVPLAAPANTIEFRCWTNDKAKVEDGRFDWRLEVSVPAGGIQRRAGSLDFVAPVTGYAKTVTMQMPLSMKRPDWQDDLEQLYWVKLKSGVFGRIKVRMIASGDHYSIVSGYVNARPGSRNLSAGTPSKH